MMKQNTLSLTMSSNDGRHYFRETPQSKNTASGPSFGSARAGSLAFRGNNFIVDGVEPARYILSIRAISDVICELLEGVGQVSIKCPQSRLVNKSFHGASYVVRVRDVNQAAWDYGCMLSSL